MIKKLALIARTTVSKDGPQWENSRCPEKVVVAMTAVGVELNTVKGKNGYENQLPHTPPRTQTRWGNR